LPEFNDSYGQCTPIATVPRSWQCLANGALSCTNIAGWTLVNLRFTAAGALAILGIVAGVVIGHRGSDASGAVRIVPVAATSDAAPQRTVEAWLVEIRQRLAIRPDQATAWQRYANAMTNLDESRLELERQVANGEARDIAAERARHAMLLTTALNELEDHLLPQQQTDVRLLTQVLADTVICRELAVR
jgi:hypothetical protein